MRVTICELATGMFGFEHEWELLRAHVDENKPDLVLLPEMAFHKWLFGTQNFDRTRWDEGVAISKEWLNRLPELGCAVMASRPTDHHGRRRNEGFAWSEQDGYVHVHDKQHLPNFGNTWEADWYEPGDDNFPTTRVAGVRVGMLICSEIWVNDHCYDYASQGAELIVHPRATEVATRDKWQVAVRMAGIVGGAFAFSSSHYDDEDHLKMGGGAWAVDPLGEVIGEVAYPDRFLTVEIDPARARALQHFYPRNMVNSSGSRSGT